ncbi:MAG: helix-hairpin-helix domain-containing protein [Alphaproteobacteria bacterium]
MANRATNQAIAVHLREAADLLAAQQANPFRVRAYRNAAASVDRVERDVGDVLAEGGVEGLVALPGIGEALAAAIAEMARTGRWAQLERLRGTVDPEALFRAVPGIGPELARRIHDALDVDSLEDLETAAHDGRLEGVPGVGARRAAGIRAALAQMLQRGRARPRAAPADEPGVADILAVDAEYRDRAAAGSLERIAPRRFNPAGEAWLPILHAERGDWRFTALFSNTAQAHRLDRVRDWVVIYYHRDDRPEGQCTVVTETRGTLTGRRVVRGRETECRSHYAG